MLFLGILGRVVKLGLHKVMFIGLTDLSCYCSQSSTLRGSLDATVRLVTTWKDVGLSHGNHLSLLGLNILTNPRPYACGSLVAQECPFSDSDFLFQYNIWQQSFSNSDKYNDVTWGHAIGLRLQSG